MSKSYFFYIHDDVSRDPEWCKAGKAMSPHSATRLRQRTMSKIFEISDLYFGDPSDIDFLESQIKEIFKHRTGKALNGIGAQSEMLKVPKDDIRRAVSKIINECKLKVIKIKLEKPYSATNSSECPLGVPSEYRSHDFLAKVVKDHFVKNTNYYFEADDLYLEPPVLTEVVETVAVQDEQVVSPKNKNIFMRLLTKIA